MKKSKDPHIFEIELKNGQSKTFSNGYQMWKWYSTRNKRAEFKDEKKEESTLSEFFRRRNPNK